MYVYIYRTPPWPSEAPPRRKRRPDECRVQCAGLKVEGAGFKLQGLMPSR